MITTTHARPHRNPAARPLPQSRVVVCPRCGKPLGAAMGAVDSQRLLSTHRCTAAMRDVVQPSPSVPFS